MYWQPDGCRSLTEQEVTIVRKSGIRVFILLFLMMTLRVDGAERRELPRKGDYNAQDTQERDASSGRADIAESDSGCVLWMNEETGYQVAVEDDADLLTDEEKALLAFDMRALTAYGNAVFKSVSYNNYSASWFAQDCYHRLMGSESGTLFLIDMSNREIYIFSDGAVYKTVTTAYANTITDNVYRYASDQDYYQCASGAFGQIHALLSGRRIAQPMKYISNALLALILAALINYFLVRILSASSKPDTREILNSVYARFAFSNVQRRLTSQSKVYQPRSTDSSGGSHGGGGGHSGAGHSGGGHSSGGGGGHRF